MIAPRLALSRLTFVDNVDEWIKEMHEWNMEVDKRKELTQNKNSGINDTNLQRQNSKVQTKDNEDNFVNATKGQSQKLSENKVE